MIFPALIQAHSPPLQVHSFCEDLRYTNGSIGWLELSIRPHSLGCPTEAPCCAASIVSVFRLLADLSTGETREGRSFPKKLLCACVSSFRRVLV